MIETLIDNLRNEDYSLQVPIFSTRPLYNHLDVRCLITENTVLNILKNYEFTPLNSFSETSSDLSWIRDDRGVSLNKESTRLQEFDEFGTINSLQFLVEVKALKLDKYVNKLPNITKLLEQKQENSNILVFFPFKYNKNEQIKTINSFPNTYAIDTDWSSKAIGRAVEQFYTLQR